MISYVAPQYWKQYELIDSGDGSKLERFGEVVLIRPEPQALWKKNLSNAEWKKLAAAEFIQKGSYNGEWKKYKDFNDSWNIKYIHGGLKLTFRLALTGFKHVGIFPEQAVNWDYIYKYFSEIDGDNTSQEYKKAATNFLNLFAYTGGISLAAKAAGCDTVHVDSVKQVINWAAKNMELSGLNNIRWTVEDALKFVKREVKRGKKYNGIALDPPSYGIGAAGERWKLEDSIDELISESVTLLDEKKYCYILNCYSLGLSPLVIENIMNYYFKNRKNLEISEIYIPSTSGQKLPLGIVARFRNE